VIHPPLRKYLVTLRRPVCTGPDRASAVACTVTVEATSPRLAINSALDSQQPKHAACLFAANDEVREVAR
jgi:hypothetical protein